MATRRFRILETSIGAVGYVADERFRLQRLILPMRSSSAVRTAVKRRYGTAVEDSGLMPGFAKQLSGYLAGRPARLEVAIDWRPFPQFQRSVLKACAKIPAGRTRSYGQLAASIGHPAASRAVGQALGANPIPLVIPCHRVVRTDGGLGGFSAAQGIALKRKLLKLEECSGLA